MSDHSEISRLKDAAEEAHYTHKDMVTDQERTEDLNRICSAFRNACGVPFESEDIATICHCFSGFLHEAGFQELSDQMIDAGDEVKPEDKK